MMDELNFKELYEVSLKSTYPIEVGDKIIEPGEIIAFFDKIQIANFQEIKSVTTTNGGFNNQPLVFWSTTKEIRINLTQGIFSKVQLALMTNSKLVDKTAEESVRVSVRKEFESDEAGKIDIENTLQYPIFIYDKNTGEKILNWGHTEKTIYLHEKYRQVIVDYQYDYYNDYTTLQIGQELTSGFLSLTGKMKVKDDTTGKVVTGIIKIPKLRLMSDLSIRVGSDAIPQVGRLEAVAVPEGARGQSKIMEIIFLNDDIDADM